MKNAFPLNFGFSTGISCIRKGHFFKETDSSIIVASQSGEVKIIQQDEKTKLFEVKKQFDFSENGAIWNMECADINNDGIDEILIGGMKGAVVCISADGEEYWVVQCKSAISGIKIWNVNSPDRTFESLKKRENDIQNPLIFVYSLDQTLRLINRKGEMLWAQMFAAGVACLTIGDVNQDGLDEIIAGGNDGTVRIFEASTGKILWFYETKENVRTLCVHQGNILCGGDSRKLFILDAKKQILIQSIDFPLFIWFVFPILETDYFFLSTYSFRYLGMDDSPEEPSIGVYSIKDFQPIWKIEGVNLQDFQLLQKNENPLKLPLLLMGETTGMLSIIRLDDGCPVFSSGFETLPSLINSVCLFNINDTIEANIAVVAGCDDGKIYFKQFEK